MIVLASPSQAIKVNNVTWVIDSGCTTHCSGNISLFDTFTPCFNICSLANGTIATCEGYGSIGDLAHVNFLPSFTYNLLSVSNLTAEGYCLTFTPDGSVVITNGTSSEIFGEYKDGLYTTPHPISITLPPTDKFLLSAEPDIEFSFLQQYPTLNRYRVHTIPPSDLMHQRLAHFNMEAIIRGQRNNLLTGWSAHIGPINFCDACARAKAHRTPKPVLYSKAKSTKPEDKIYVPFEKIMVDFSGIIHIQGYNGVYYFVLFVDHATRYKWIFFTVTRQVEEIMEVFDKFYQFISSINQTVKEITIVRAFKFDCAKEFKDATFRAYIKDRGSTIEYTSPHTSYQNGIVERAIRTVRESGFAMLLHAKMSTN